MRAGRALLDLPGFGTIPIGMPILELSYGLVTAEKMSDLVRKLKLDPSGDNLISFFARVWSSEGFDIRISSVLEDSVFGGVDEATCDNFLREWSSRLLPLLSAPVSPKPMRTKARQVDEKQCFMARNLLFQKVFSEAPVEKSGLNSPPIIDVSSPKANPLLGKQNESGLNELLEQLKQSELDDRPKQFLLGIMKYGESQLGSLGTVAFYFSKSLFQSEAEPSPATALVRINSRLSAKLTAANSAPVTEEQLKSFLADKEEASRAMGTLLTKYITSRRTWSANIGELESQKVLDKKKESKLRLGFKMLVASGLIQVE